MELLNYVVFFSSTLPKGVMELLGRVISDKCANCEKECILKIQSGKPVKPIGIFDAEDITDVNGFINYLYHEEKSDFILLVDREKDKLYLYLGETSTLSNMLHYVNFLLKKNYCVEDAADLRVSVIIQDTPGVN